MSFEKFVSNLIEDQFPEHYRENGPILVEFVKQYYTWLESKTESRNDWITRNRSSVNIVVNSANVTGKDSFFTENYSDGDKIAIAIDKHTEDFEIFTINEISNNSFLTLTEDKLPLVSISNTYHSTVSEKGNPVYLSRRFAEIVDIDETFEEYLLYFKEKYLKGIQFDTLTNTRKLVKHSLDLYRSKGTERSIDLLYKVVFGKPASVYYPAQDIFRLSSGKWKIPEYLELSLSKDNVNLINKQVQGVVSGATCFIEEVARILIDEKVIDVAYISAIKGNFISGERIRAADVENSPVIVGSLNEVQLSITGVGSGFELNELVDISSDTGIGGKGKVIAVANSSGTLDITLTDGGYAYSNTRQEAFITGTVNVISSNLSIEGIGTVFPNELTSGDLITVYGNSTYSELREVDEIFSNTLLTVNTGFTFTNGASNIAYTRFTAQTFISEKVITISNCTINNTFTWHDYFRFGEQITQPTVSLNYEQANNLFAQGDMIYTYHANNDVKGQGEIIFLSRRTSNAGLIVASLLTGNLNSTTIYTTANAVSATLNVANGFNDVTATANVIGTYSNVSISCNNVTGTFEEGEMLFQPTSDAEGYVSGIIDLGNNNIILSVSNSYGIFKSGSFVWGMTSGAQGDIAEFEIDVGIIDIDNTFLTYPNNYTVATNGHISGKVTSVSLGTGAAIEVGNTLLYTETVDINSDVIQPYLSYRLKIPVSVTVDTSANNTTLLFLDSGNTQDLAVGFRISNSSNLAVINTAISSEIANVVNSTAVITNADIIVANGSADFEALVDWPFPANVQTDMESLIVNSWSFDTLTIGKIDKLTYGAGIDYNKAPVIRAWEPNTWIANKYDTYEFSISSLTVPFLVGEIVTQTATNARGIVLEGSTDSVIRIQNLRFYANNKFELTSNSTTLLVGSDSLAEANIDVIEERFFSPRFGLNTMLDIFSSSVEGAITEIEVNDSGFGFINNQTVTISSNNKTANGTGLLKTHGTGTGFYQTRDGFLSDTKKLSDGWYYQEYSYDVRSAVINEFKNNLKNVLHVAGTKYFNSLFYDTLIFANNEVSSNVYQASDLYTGYFPIQDYNEMRFYYVYEDDENIFPILDYQLLDIGPFDLNADPTLTNYINTQIDLNYEPYQIINIMYDCETESETIDLENDLRRY